MDQIYKIENLFLFREESNTEYMHHTYIIPVVSVVDPDPAFQVNPDLKPVPNP
jgi:hypothetical protein